MEGKRRLIKDILWFLVFWGLLAAIFRMWFGLGPTTNLSDEVPWGLWKILNMVAGVALSTGGFTLGILVYVLRLKQFKPLVRMAVLVAFLGYGSSLFALLFDIGLPHRFWHPFVMWNENSFLFEVFWCVALYFTVTMLEIIPTVGERWGNSKIFHWLEGIAFGIVVFGISLSSLHHSSLGSLFLVTPQRLHPLWYSSLLPLFFIISAMGAGMMTIVLIKILYAKLYDPVSVFGPVSQQTACVINPQDPNNKPKTVPGKDLPMLTNMALIAGGVLSVYLALKVSDLFRTGSWNALTASSWESWLYLGELGLIAVIPVLLISIPRIRRSPVGLGWAAFSAAAGLALNRMSVGIFGYFRDAGTVYFPSLIEWALCFGVVAAAGLVFLFATENLPIMTDLSRRQHSLAKMFAPSFDRISHVWHTVFTDGLRRVSIIAVFAIPLCWVLLYPGYRDYQDTDIHVQPAIGLDVQRDTLLIDGNRRGVVTTFAHADHQRRLAGDTSCAHCHHISLPHDRSTPCSRCHRRMAYPTKIFDHTFHIAAVAETADVSGLHPENHSCRECHPAPGPKTGQNAHTCYSCHQEDMWLIGQPDSTANLMHAPSFSTAMHHTCIPCHRQEEDRTEAADLTTCGTCHKSRRHASPGRPVRADFADRTP